MEQRYIKLREQLDDFGYKLPLIPDAVPLVEKLFGDLIQTTESLRRYMQIAKELVEERDKLELGAEPYKCDNAKLVKECNDLHLAFLQFKEQHENSQKEHRRKVAILEKEKRELSNEIQTVRSNLFQVETKLRGCRCPKVIANKLQSKSAISLTSSKSQILNTMSKSKSARESTNPNIAQDKINELKDEIKRLQNEQMKLLSNNECLQTQIANRDKEVSRLSEMLQGGRPRDAVNLDCCYKDVDIQMNKMQDEITNLRRSNADLEEKLREAICKQHEAMKRALHLAERNKQLEREMTDIDQMALAVEAECNNTVKSNATKLNKLQEQLQDTAIQLRSIERETTDLKREKQGLTSDLEVMKLEKKHLQNVLETALEEKKRMNDKLNRFTRIENDLNNEIDRLVQLTSEQKCKIADLECRMLYGVGDADYVQLSKERITSPDSAINKGKTRSKSPSSPRKSPTRRKDSSKATGKTTATTKKKGKKKKRIGTKSPASASDSEGDTMNVPKNSPHTARFHSINSSDLESLVCCNPGHCSIHTSRQNTTRLPPCIIQNKGQLCPCCSCRLTTVTSRLTPAKEYNTDIYGHERNTPAYATSKDVTGDVQRQSQITEQLIAEKDYYMREYHKLVDEFKSANIQSEIGNIRKQLIENEQQIRQLQHENKSLAQDKHNLMTRLETTRDQTDFDAYNITLKSSVKRLERENELLKDDISKLEEDRELARQKLKMMHDTYKSEKDVYEKKIKLIEDELNKIEIERRGWLQSKDSATSVKYLEDQSSLLQEQLKQCHTDLNQQRALYSQLKTLHEQTDKSLSESQKAVQQLERQLENCQDRNQDLERSRQALEKELTNMKGEVLHVKGSMGKIDSEKDSLLLSLDDKTERIANLETELKAREKIIRNLEDDINDLRRKIGSTIQESSSKDHIFRAMQSEIKSVKDELESCSRAKDLAMQENRRIQEDLLACTTDCKQTHTELDMAKRQVEDLKRQLQTYVAEVKRTEDLISHKEIERSEMLDQFRSLSQEATALENNNHTLEHEATQSRMQLSLALDHASDVERRLESQETLIRSYERQIADMTSQIASLEVQLTSKCKLFEKVEAELKATKDLCVKLDEQKEYLTRQLGERQSVTVQMDRDRDRLRREGEALQSNLTHDRHNVESLEKLLRQCRQENVEQNILNQDLQTEINKLKQKIDDLQVKLNSNLPSSNTITVSGRYATSLTSSGKYQKTTKGIDKCSCKNIKNYETSSKSKSTSDAYSRSSISPSMVVFAPKSKKDFSDTNDFILSSNDSIEAVYDVQEINSDSSLDNPENKNKSITLRDSHKRTSKSTSTNTDNLIGKNVCPCYYLCDSNFKVNVPVDMKYNYICRCAHCICHRQYDHIRATYSFTKTLAQSKLTNNNNNNNVIVDTNVSPKKCYN